MNEQRLEESIMPMKKWYKLTDHDLENMSARRLFSYHTQMNKDIQVKTVLAEGEYSPVYVQMKIEEQMRIQRKA
jgi:hypothetical protein